MIDASSMPSADCPLSLWSTRMTRRRGARATFVLGRGEEVLRGLREQGVRLDEEHVGLHHLGDRVRQVDEPGGPVCVLLGAHHSAPARAGELEEFIGGPCAAGHHEARDAGLDRHRLGAPAIADDERVARLHPGDHRLRLHGAHEHAARQHGVRVARQQVAVEHLDEAPDRHRPVLEP
jgi:hypothetical protein